MDLKEEIIAEYVAFVSTWPNGTELGIFKID